VLADARRSASTALGLPEVTHASAEIPKEMVMLSKTPWSAFAAAALVLQSRWRATVPQGTGKRPEEDSSEACRVFTFIPKRI